MPQEYGSETGYGPSRNAILSLELESANAAGYAGALVWEVRSSAQTYPSSWDFMYTEDGSASVLAEYSYMATKVSKEPCRGCSMCVLGQV